MSNLSNEKIIRRYLKYLSDSKGLSKATTDIFLRSIRKFNELNKDKDFSKITINNIVDIKSKLKENLNIRTYLMYMKQLHNFYLWLSSQKGFKVKLFDKVEYFTLSKKDKQLDFCSSQEIKEFPNLAYVKKLVNSIPATTDINKRDRALISFLCLTGVREDSLVSLSMRCVNIDRLYVKIYPSMQVRTKFNKTIISKIFHFDNELVDIFIDWYNLLKDKGFEDKAPLFPKSKITKNANNLSFTNNELSKEFMTTANVRRLLKELCKKYNLHHYSPHRYRDLAINLALSKIPYGEYIKIISQNFGHSDIATTIDCYSSFNPNQLLDKLEKLDNEINDVKYEPKFEVINFDENDEDEKNKKVG